MTTYYLLYLKYTTIKNNWVNAEASFSGSLVFPLILMVVINTYDTDSLVCKTMEVSIH